MCWLGPPAQSGVELLVEVRRTAAQVDYMQDQRKRLVYCLDPEGNLLELCPLSQARPHENADRRLVIQLLKHCRHGIWHEQNT